MNNNPQYFLACKILRVQSDPCKRPSFMLL